MSQKGSIVALIILLISLSGTLFAIGLFLGRQNSLSNLSNINDQSVVKITGNTTKIKKDKCKFYGYLSNKDNYLSKYTVQKGDTLAAIAKSYLGNLDRTKEIIFLNEDRYKNLYTDTFLEIGWELYLPPLYAFPTQQLAGYSGEVIDQTEDLMNIEIYGSDTKDAHPLLKIRKDPKTKYFEKNAFDKGDCVGVLVDAVNPGEGYKLVAIAREESYKKYFTQFSEGLNK